MTVLNGISFFANMAAIAFFVAIAVISSKRIGGAGPWLLASVGLIDGLLILSFRVYLLIAPAPGLSLDRGLEWLRLFDAASMYGSGFLALVGLGLLMPKTPRPR